jgi:arsenite methyltransferase
MNPFDADKIRQSVRQSYASVAKAANENKSHGVAVSCCGVSANSQGIASVELGYSHEQLLAIPKGADMGLGCGNPQAIAQIQKNETVLDLGSGGGFDCFLASRQLQGTGLVIGVDMTADMISKAREHAEKMPFDNVEFRLGEIEHLPVADNSVDVIISNCVINLSPDKKQAFKDCFRVLKSGGRLAISDIVAIKPLPDKLRSDAALYSGCMAGACLIFELETMLSDAGFLDISIDVKEDSCDFIKNWAPNSNIEDYVLSATIVAKKP